MARRCYLIANPTSGTFSRRKIDRIIADLTRSGLEPVLLLTGSALDPTLFAARICATEDAPLIVVAGGGRDHQRRDKRADAGEGDAGGHSHGDQQRPGARAQDAGG